MLVYINRSLCWLYSPSVYTQGTFPPPGKKGFRKGFYCCVLFFDGGAKVGSGAGWFGALHGAQEEITCEKSPMKSWGCFRESVGPTWGIRRAQSPSWPLTLGPDRSRRRSFSPPCLAGVGGWGGRLLRSVPGTREESWVLCGTTPGVASPLLLSSVVVLSVFPRVGALLAVPRMKCRRW